MALFLAYDVASNPLNTNEWAFPVCEVLHIIGFAIAIGTITMVDLRLLGIGMKKESAADLVKDTGPWTLGGLALVLISGPLIFSSDRNHHHGGPAAAGHRDEEGIGRGPGEGHRPMDPGWPGAGADLRPPDFLLGSQPIPAQRFVPVQDHSPGAGD